MRLTTILFLILFLVTNLNAEELIEKGRLSCTADDTIDSSAAGTIVTFLNGIKNNPIDSEKSRIKLENELKRLSVCTSETCIVEKFYNKTDGFIDDTQELSFVGQDLEEFTANQALASLILKIRIQYILYKSFISRNNANVDFSSDTKLVSYMNNAYNDLKDGESNNFYVNFSQWGEKLAESIIDLLKEEFDIESTNNSYYLKSIENQRYSLNLFFKSTFESKLTSNYLSNREFYSDDSNAVQAITRTVEGLITYLEEHYLSGKKIVVVSHSQGNHIVELAYGVLKQKHGLNFTNAVKVVGVASVASTTPNSTYVTSSEDNTVISLYGFLNGEPLPANFDLSDGDGGIGGHSFTDIYLNASLKGVYSPFGGNISETITTPHQTNLRDVVIRLVEGSINVAVAHIAQIDSSRAIITSSLRWENYPDMDLWINEPDTSNNVYFRNKLGLYGKLDRDDTDGEGPEHYTLYSTVTCSDLENEEWLFGIQQYPRGGSNAIAHISIKILGTALAHKSYSSNNWPSDIQWIGSVKFGERNENTNIMEYEVSLSSSLAAARQSNRHKRMPEQYIPVK